MFDTMLEQTALILNPNLRLYDFQNERYGFLGAYPYRLGYLRVSRALENLLNRFDGETTFAEIAATYAIDETVARFLRVLVWNDVLVPAPITPQSIPPMRKASMSIFPTSICNLRCVYCYASAGDTPKVIILPEVAVTAMEHFFNNLAEYVTHVDLIFHGGGEPTVAFDILESCYAWFKDHAARRGLKPSARMTTNGNFKPQVRDWMLREKIGITVSLDGPGAINDALRPRADGRGSFQHARSSLRALTEAGNGTSIRATITPMNLPYMNDIVELAAELRVPNVNFGPGNDFGRSYGLLSIQPPKDEFVDSVVGAFRLGLQRDVNVSSDSIQIFKQGTGYHCSPSNEPTFAVTPEGRVSYCCEVSLAEDSASSEFFYGKVTDDGVEIDARQAERLMTRTAKKVEGCSSCFLQHTCAGGCAIKAYRLTGDFYGKDWYTCEMRRRVSGTLVQSIIEQEFIPREHVQPHISALGGDTRVPNEYNARFVGMNLPGMRRRARNDLERLLFPDFAPPTHKTALELSTPTAS